MFPQGRTVSRFRSSSEVSEADEASETLKEALQRFEEQVKKYLAGEETIGVVDMYKMAAIKKGAGYQHIATVWKRNRRETNAMSSNVICYKVWPGIKEDASAAGYDGPGWYFWDETLAHCYGPFGTEDEAETALTKYVEEEL